MVTHLLNDFTDESSIESMERKLDIEQALLILTEREREILSLRLYEHTHKEIGDKVGYDRSNISKIVKKIHKTLENSVVVYRDNSAKYRLIPYLMPQASSNIVNKCICGKVISRNFKLCKDCENKYGLDRNKWPEWLAYLVADTKREYEGEIEIDANEFTFTDLGLDLFMERDDFGNQ